MKLSTVALTASLAAMALPATANAAVYLITYTGTVAGGYDGAGVFGTADTSLNGLAFTATYTLTDPMPGAGVLDTTRRREIYGGTIYGISALPVSGAITINGTTITVDGTYQSLASQHNGFPFGGLDGYDQVYHVADNGSEWIKVSIGSFENNIVSSTYYTAPLNYTLQSGDQSISSFQVKSVAGQLAATSVTIALADNVSPVPEPTTWAMLVAGFGIIGSNMRRRKTAISFA